MRFIEDFPCPQNDGNLPLIIERDEHGKIIRITIDWQGTTIREQFPWTRALNES